MIPDDPDGTLIPGDESPKDPPLSMDVTAESHPTGRTTPLAGQHETSLDSKSWGGEALASGANAKGVQTGSRYKILRPLGEGGFGIVYLADQSEPVRRKVALKVLKMAFASPATLARFAAEQQALAIMDHPGLAKVFDAGTTPDGQPYFAMEYAPGEPLASFCDSRRIGLRARIELLAQICDAIQHAHMKGVVHRDLKPGNILVAETDEGFRPKVIDFGIAKAVSASASENTHETQFGQFVGTPVYMSPEQAEGGSIDIDTRSDIYSMGVILYELLVGKTPIESETLRKSGIAHLHRTLLETDPLRPSVRLDKMPPAERESICAARRSEYAPLMRQLRRDLDWITMRCLEKDRTRRYESASALAADLRRYLAGEAVLAGPPGNAYRIHKFVRRHRVGVAVAAAATLGLIAFAVSMWVLWQDATRQQLRAEQTLGVFKSALGASDLTGSQSDSSNTVQGLLLKVEEDALKSLADQPDILVELRETIGPVFTSLSDYDSARRNIIPLVEFRRARAASGDIDDGVALAKALHEQGRVLFFLRQYTESRAAYEESLALRTQLLRANHPDIGTSLLHLSAVYRALGDSTLSDKASDDAIALFRRITDDRQERLGAALFSRGDSLRKVKRFDEARAFINEAIEVFIKNEGPNYWRVGRALGLLGDIEASNGRYDLAVVHQRRAIDLMLPRFGATHPTVTQARQNCALSLARLATGDSSSLEGATVKDAAALAEALKQTRLAVDGRAQNDKSPIDTAHSLALLSLLSELNGDRAGAIASESRIVNMLQERAPQAAEQIVRAQKRLAGLQQPSAAPLD